jgi:hypothetical protein
MTLQNRPAAASRKKHQVGGPELGKGVGPEARRLAAAILEVLAGARTPTEAATALGLSLPRYYQIEAQALRGLLAACAPKPRGRVRSVDSELRAVRQENQRLQRDLTRQQALARAAQRAVGLSPPPPVSKTGKKPRQRRLARALSVAARLQEATPADKTATMANPTTTATSPTQ